MSVRKLKVVLTRKLPEPVETRMRELFDAELNLDDRAFGEQELKDAMGRAEVLCCTITDNITADLIAARGESLKMIANFGAGMDHIDVPAAVAAGLIATNTPGVLTEDTADMTMGLILATARRFVEGADIIRAGKFTGWTPTWMTGRRIWGKRLGIIGMGRIGQAVARRGRAFGLSIHYHNRRQANPAVVEDLNATYWDDLDQMLARVDIVSINCPLTPQTHHLMDARRLALLQPHAVLVNTSRGEVIDEEALAAALKAHSFAGAGLDVFEHEPAVHPDLVGLPNVVLLPHMGSATIEGRIDMGERVILNIKTLQDGHRPPDRVIPV